MLTLDGRWDLSLLAVSKRLHLAMLVAICPLIFGLFSLNNAGNDPILRPAFDRFLVALIEFLGFFVEHKVSVLT